MEPSESLEKLFSSLRGLFLSRDKQSPRIFTSKWKTRKTISKSLNKALFPRGIEATHGWFNLGSSAPQPKPRRKSLVKERMSTSSSRESLDSDNRDSLLDRSLPSRRPKSRIPYHRNTAIQRHEATQTSQYVFYV